MNRLLRVLLLPGHVVNIAGMDEDCEDLVRSGYGETCDRVVEVKNRGDPENLFRMNQKIESNR